MKHIAELLVGHDIVRTNFREPFTWTSGIKSPIYCDCRELISIPEARETIVKAWLEEINRLNLTPNQIAGTATAGIPWAAFVADKLKASMLYVRSKPKGHGAGKMVEGRGQENAKVLVVEDALSTAGSSIVSANALRNEVKASVEHIFAIFSWDTPISHEKSSEANLTLNPLTVFEEIQTVLLESGKINQDEFNELDRFRLSPADWWKQ